MNTPDFVHLRLHTEYSIVDGLVRLDEVVAAAAKDGQAALAITDLANLFGMVKFYKACRDKGIKPLIACDVWISNDAEVWRMKQVSRPVWISALATNFSTSRVMSVRRGPEVRMRRVCNCCFIVEWPFRAQPAWTPDSPVF